MQSLSFEQLGLNERLCKHLTVLGFNTPTPIQNESIPMVLCGQDVIASAQTGSGKTASFLLPLLHILEDIRLKARMPRAIIMEPTRELALQVFDQFTRFSDGSLKAALLVGGESMTQQERILNSNPDVLIATPGRLLDLCERQKVMLFGIRYVVIDEADRMLDMGFLPDVKRIMEKIPLSRQTMLFSATFDDEIRKLTHQFMLAPKIVNISRAGSTVDSIEQYFVMAGDKQKRIITRHIIQTYGKNTENKVPTIIFCNRKTQVTTLVSSLRRHKFAADSLHGDLQQSTRNQTVERFRSGEIHVLVASDIAARGLDVADLGLVINFDVPVNAEDYVHRIGRTGRAGKSGFAFTLIEKRDQKQWKAIEKLTEQQIREFVVPEELFEVKQQVKNTAEKKEKLDKSEVVAESLEQHVRLIPDNNKRRRPLRSPRIMQKNTAVVSVDVLCENNGYDRTEVFDKTKNVKTDSYQPKNNLNTDGLFLNKNKTLGFGEEPPAFFKQDSYRKFLTTDNLTSDLFIHNNEEASKSHEKNNTPKQNEAPI